MKDVVTFTRIDLPTGWLSNMSQHPVEFAGKEWRTVEALFQSLRFNDDDIKELIRAERSPMSAKQVMNENSESIALIKHGKRDVLNMKMCLRIKLLFHPILIGKLVETEDKRIIEDVTARGDVGGNLFWGAMLIDGEWHGQNVLGNLWMEIREEYKNQ
jgi:predicted NAD-dependent protein-ADP-ribosyltransferase YbiA (DUF1768 family)